MLKKSNIRWKKHRGLCWNSIKVKPDRKCQTLEPPNPSINVYKLHNTRRSTNSECNRKRYTYICEKQGLRLYSTIAIECVGIELTVDGDWYGDSFSFSPRKYCAFPPFEARLGCGPTDQHDDLLRAFPKVRPDSGETFYPLFWRISTVWLTIRRSVTSIDSKLLKLRNAQSG